MYYIVKGVPMKQGTKKGLLEYIQSNPDKVWTMEKKEYSIDGVCNYEHVESITTTGKTAKDCFEIQKTSTKGEPYLSWVQLPKRGSYSIDGGYFDMAFNYNDRLAIYICEVLK